MDPDIQRSATSGHVSTFIAKGVRYDRIFRTERFNEGMQSMLDAVETTHAVDLDAIPGSTNPKPQPHARPPGRGLFSMHLMWEIYHRHFRLFRYDVENPADRPIPEINRDEVHAKLG